jgi:hypothetical protein
MLALYPANWRLSPSIVFYDPRALAQRNCCVWPALARSPIRRPRNNEVLQAGEVLNDVLAVLTPDVDAINKVGSGSGLVINHWIGSWLIGGCVDRAGDDLELRVQRPRGRERHAKCPLYRLPDRPDANGEVLE